MLRRGTAPAATTPEAPADWVLPHWLDRRLDPASSATPPRWTAIGNLDSASEATIDPRGLVTVAPGGWSLDWWVGADDRWHLPSREVAVRQHLVEDMPVVETAMRVPSGDVVHRAYAVRAGEVELVVIEIENRSPIPVALALAVRPFGPAGVAPVRRIELVGDEHVAVDGRVALVLPKPPSRLAGSTFESGDVAATVLAGEAGGVLDPVVCEAGMASAALIWPLAHRTMLRFALPLERPARARRVVAGAWPAPAGLPASEQVVNGWRVQGGRGLRLVLPDERLQSAVDANRRFLLLRHDAADLPITTVAALAGALDRQGFGPESAELLTARAEDQRSGGSFGDGGTVNGAVLHALADHWRLHRGIELVERLAPAVAQGAEWIERRRRRSRRGPDDLWAVRGLVDAAELLRAAGEDTGADAASGFAASYREELDDLAAASLDAAWPLGLVAGDDPRIEMALAAARDDAESDAGASARLALVELAAGDRRALGRLTALLDAASPTWTWSGGDGEGHDLLAVAGVLDLARHLLVREEPGGLALCSLVPDDWLGRGIEVHDAPTAAGRLSFAVRWHGDRPALLWELAPHPGVPAVTFRAPGLDPTWSSDEVAGDALLAPVLPPGTPVRLQRR